MTINHVFAKDWPEANGRQALDGEKGYNLTFAICDGSSLIVHCGQQTLDAFADMIGRLMIDNALEPPVDPHAFHGPEC